jgi:hypothetical protein
VNPKFPDFKGDDSIDMARFDVFSVAGSVVWLPNREREPWKIKTNTFQGTISHAPRSGVTVRGSRETQTLESFVARVIASSY